MAADAEPGDGEMAAAPGSPNHQELGLVGEGEQAQVKLLVNKEGRYVCMLCHKTFKTVRPWGQGPTAPLPVPVQCRALSLTAPPHRAASSRPTW